MRKLSILLIVAICAGSCLRDFEDTSFVPEKLDMSWSEPSMTVTKDATSFEVTLHSNLPWMIKPSVSWLSVSPDRGTADAVITVKVAKNRTVEDRSGYLRAIVTADQFSDFPITQGKNDSSGGSVTYYVKADGNPEASGLSWTNATTLTNAFDLAGDGDAIYVAAGLYSPQAFLEGTDETDQADRTFQIHSNFTLQGGFPANADDATFDPVAHYDPSVNVTTLSGTLDGGKNAYHVVVVSAAKVEGQKAVLKGFTITGGSTSDEKEVFFTAGGNTFYRGYGAGINVGASVLDIEDCVITGNVANLNAAGAYFYVNSQVSMTDCRVVSNETKGNAGGVWNCGGTLYMNRCSISDNIAAGQCAGFYSINSEGAPALAGFTTVPSPVMTIQLPPAAPEAAPTSANGPTPYL